MKEVELTIDNYAKCVCPVCPVQADSKCIAGKKENWKQVRIAVGEILKEYPSHPEAYDMEMGQLEQNEVGERHDFEKPDPKDMIELYCSAAVGRSSCGDDLDEAKPCQCPSCAVWKSHQLDSTYYCTTKG